MPDPTSRTLPAPVAVLLVPVVALLAVLVTQLVASDDTGAVAGGGANAITIRDFTFAPTPLVVAPGATVKVANADGTTHTVTATGGAFDTGDVAGGARATFRAPTKPGSYAYICDIHQYMQGTLEVKG